MQSEPRRLQALAADQQELGNLHSLSGKEKTGKFKRGTVLCTHVAHSLAGSAALTEGGPHFAHQVGRYRG